jgi:predicted nuclease of restriction endonuclease-like (RecB) superfamily
VERQERVRWGSAVLDRLSDDLNRAFPGVSGFSRRNLYRMRAFFLAYRETEDMVSQPVAQIPWGHNVVLLEQVKDAAQRRWYARQVIENGWSRAILTHQIETDLYGRQVTTQKTTTFPKALPPPQSDLAEQALKDPYIFDFLTLGQEARERDLERGLLEKIRDFLLELGAGFAFMGNQYHLEVGGQDFYVDLLFYHHRLRCLVALDLKMDDFRPEYAGKMNFYLSALDDLVRHPQDAPSLGLVLCKGKNRTIAEYALRDVYKPIGVAEYRLTQTLPAALQNALPAPGALERLIEEEGDAPGS